MFELKLHQLIGHNLPKISYFSAIANRILKPIYNRRKRNLVITNVLGFKMELDSTQCVDGNLLFCPQLYDSKEIDFLNNNLNMGDVFVDLGANIGFYSLMASKKTKNILCIEASPVTFKLLERNLNLNSLEIKSVNCGVSNSFETLKLTQSSINNSGGQTFINTNNNLGIDIKCKPLIQILKEQMINQIKILKIDIEGFEYKVLKHFFENSEKSVYPRYIITEFHQDEVYLTTGNQISLMENYGYQIILESGINTILKLNDNI